MCIGRKHLGLFNVHARIFWRPQLKVLASPVKVSSSETAATAGNQVQAAQRYKHVSGGGP